jgi:rhodanese-related sulfurtransferase
MPWWWPFGRVADIAARELQARLQGSTPPQLIDVRSELEWRSSRIAGAVNVPVTDLKAKLAELGMDRARPVVAICLTAHRSIPAVRMLRAQGFDACQLRQGMRAWWCAELPVERGGGGPARGE